MDRRYGLGRLFSFVFTKHNLVLRVTRLGDDNDSNDADLYDLFYSITSLGLHAMLGYALVPET